MIAPIWIAGLPYYYDDSAGVYYAPAPAGGYTVVEPPLGAAPDQAPANTSTEPIFYPNNGQTEAQIEADREDCNRWAATQQEAAADANVFAQTVAACMAQRGYTVG